MYLVNARNKNYDELVELGAQIGIKIREMDENRLDTKVRHTNINPYPRVLLEYTDHRWLPQDLIVVFTLDKNICEVINTEFMLRQALGKVGINYF